MQKRIDMIGLLLSSPTSKPRMKVLIVLAVLGSPLSMGQQQATAAVAYQWVRSVGSSGSGNTQFNQPWGVSADSSGNVWVADRSNNRIKEFDSRGDW